MNPDTEKGPDFDVFRLRLGDAVALLAAFALLFIMAGDWYSTTEGVQAREIVKSEGSEQPAAGLIDEGSAEDAKVAAEKAERNAWQLSSAFDLLVLLALLATIAIAIAAAALRAAGSSLAFRGRSPTVLAAYSAMLALVLVFVQVVLRLDPNSPVVMRIGLPLGVMALGAIVVGAGLVVREQGEPADGPRGERRVPSGASDQAGPARSESAGAATYNRGP